MIGNYSARLTGSKRNLLALLASSIVFSAGCSNMSSTAPAVNSLSTAATLSGKVHGGNQPVIGATVTLWFAGQGAPAILAATTTTDTTGSFNFTKDTAGGHDGTTPNWSCPSTGGSPLVYVLSQGGNTQNNGIATQTNTAADFIALYGDCPTITGANFVYMSEVTTVATMAAVQQFFNPADHTLRADSTGQQRLVMLNLPNTVAILADAATGLANASKSISAAGGGSIAPGVALTATPEAAKINTLANILSACVNGADATASACGTLFSAAAPPTLTAAPSPRPRTPFRLSFTSSPIPPTATPRTCPLSSASSPQSARLMCLPSRPRQPTGPSESATPALDPPAVPATSSPRPPTSTSTVRITCGSEMPRPAAISPRSRLQAHPSFASTSIRAPQRPAELLMRMPLPPTITAPTSGSPAPRRCIVTTPSQKQRSPFPLACYLLPSRRTAQGTCTSPLPMALPVHSICCLLLRLPPLPSLPFKSPTPSVLTPCV